MWSPTSCPTALETAVTLLGGMVAGIVNPINPLLEPEQISAILRETKAKVVVTLQAFPKTDVPQKVAEAVRHAPSVTDRAGGGPVPLPDPAEEAGSCRSSGPKNPTSSTRRDGQELHRRDWPRSPPTGWPSPTRPKTASPPISTPAAPPACPRSRSTAFRAWSTTAGSGHRLLFTRDRRGDLPPAAVPRLCRLSGPDVDDRQRRACGLPDPGRAIAAKGVFDNFWKLVERWKVTYLITVPTALVGADAAPGQCRCLKPARTRSPARRPLPIELYNRFEKATGVQDHRRLRADRSAPASSSVNPPEGVKKIGSVGIPFPYTHVRILHFAARRRRRARNARRTRWARSASPIPGVFAGSTYTEADKNRDLFAEGRYPAHRRSGAARRRRLSLHHRPRQGPDHPGRPQHRPRRDRGGADAPRGRGLRRRDRPARRLCGRIALRLCRTGQGGRRSRPRSCWSSPAAHIHERAAVPKHIEVLPELPKTAVGKVFKPDLRRLAITRVYDAALAEAGLRRACRRRWSRTRSAALSRGLARGQTVDEAAVRKVLGEFSGAWDWAA